ncbi:MAG: class I SAM-dependent methyltransferase [Candidatus Electrothrix sp. AX5]|nr:class I SAM-dependent methyltransferase [Candidatus Electrothrix sp. AX5]
MPRGNLSCKIQQYNDMKDKTEWDKCYDDNELPWDTGMPEISLINLISLWPKGISRVLEVGCGTGTNAVWLAEQGLEVTAMDISEKAIAVAEKRCAQHEVQCRLLTDNFLTCAPVGQYDLLFDRGCFHCTDGEEARQSFVRQAALNLKPGGYWLSLIGNKDQVATDKKGPPRLSAAEVCSAVEPAFEILSLESVLKPLPKLPKPLRFWHCLMRTR